TPFLVVYLGFISILKMQDGTYIKLVFES
ncbi:hypothetical protein, partial [Plasmodium yoelii yoelii]